MGVSWCLKKTHKTTAAMTKTTEPCRSVTFPRNPQRPEGDKFGEAAVSLPVWIPLVWALITLSASEEKVDSAFLHLYNISICGKQKHFLSLFICVLCILVPSDIIFRHIWLESVCEHVKIWNLCMFLLGMKNGAATVEISLTVSLRISIV